MHHMNERKLIASSQMGAIRRHGLLLYLVHEVERRRAHGLCSEVECQSDESCLAAAELSWPPPRTARLRLGEHR